MTAYIRVITKEPQVEYNHVFVISKYWMPKWTVEEIKETLNHDNWFYVVPPAPNNYAHKIYVDNILGLTFTFVGEDKSNLKLMINKENGKVDLYEP